MGKKVLYSLASPQVCLNHLSMLGANMEAKNEAGETALHFATKHGKIDCLLILDKRGANKEARNGND